MRLVLYLNKNDIYQLVSRGFSDEKILLRSLVEALNYMKFENLWNILNKVTKSSNWNYLNIYWDEESIYIDDDIIIEAFQDSWPAGEEIALILSLQNFREILQTWKTMLMDKPRYLVIMQDDDGWVKIQGKHELSVEDQQSIEEDNKTFPMK